MKTKIIIGSLLAVCMLVMLPSISALESIAVEETKRSYTVEEFVQTIFDKMRTIATKILLLPLTLFLIIVRAIFGNPSTDVPSLIPVQPEV